MIESQSAGPLAIAALICGIAGCVFSVFAWIPCVGSVFFLLGLLVAPAGAIMGYLEGANISRGQAPAAGRGLAKVGMILGCVGVGILVIRIGVCLLCSVGWLGLNALPLLGGEYS
jgi:hypothetical protein